MIESCIFILGYFALDCGIGFAGSKFERAMLRVSFDERRSLNLKINTLVAWRRLTLSFCDASLTMFAQTLNDNFYFTFPRLHSFLHVDPSLSYLLAKRNSVFILTSVNFACPASLYSQRLFF